MRRIYYINDLCNGCMLCALFCSFALYRKYNPIKSKIKIIKVREQPILLVDCDGKTCIKRGSSPQCVEVCPTGALIFADVEDASKMIEEFLTLRSKQPIFKVIAPWKWPYNWAPCKW